MTHGAFREARFEREAMPHMGSLLGAACRLTSCRETAEDLVQETMLRGWRAFDQFAAGTNGKAWLFRIMLNLLSKQRQKKQNRPTIVSLDQHCEHHEMALPVETPPRLSPGEMLALLETLPVEQRTLLILAIVEGFTCQEIADLQSIPIGTVMSRLSRARAELRHLLATRFNLTPAAPPQRNL